MHKHSLWLSIAIASLLSAPLFAYAQNICEVADAECPDTVAHEETPHPCFCPVTVLGVPLATIAGICLAPMKCQETAIIPLPTISTLMVGGGLGASVLFQTLMSSGGGSSQGQGGETTLTGTSYYGGSFGTPGQSWPSVANQITSEPQPQLITDVLHS